ncbi:hypothetical protein M406DRAFT_88481 [Cryphonectria parasitica EP155]|uniref:Nephrocystin 3-like N-terminal domain-containing protein n=1 Tax=Cryphonectria parasitica (strain ATCC 38755 / EP155) TaxID=660469 RepID=A0A9P4Y389_CRYP1|nr:uncharacterized protein M406DRAFT_88481 [Cryphonectria parasitica EP155]KAF3765640.1 hypothetical protein M406DRAFT_88481 [Cryphonectria parasitica EP155]
MFLLHMAGSSDFTVTERRIRLHSPAIDFIDTILPRYHAISEHPDIVCDGVSKKFAAVVAPVDATGGRTQAAITPQLAVRQLPTEVEDMKFWEPIWPKAIARLKETVEAPHRKEKGCSIRETKTWAEIQEVLERARNEYEGIKTSPKLYQKVFKKVKGQGRLWSEKVATPVQQFIKIMPNHPVANPVLGAVNLLMNAWKEAAKIRRELAETLDETALRSLFADINMYSEMYQDDPNIIRASVNLLSTIFKAVEGAIGFYISWQVSRIGGLTFVGEEYLEPFRNSLRQIKVDEDNLAKEAQKTCLWQQNEIREFQCELCHIELPRIGSVNHDVATIHSAESRLPISEPRALPASDNSITPQTLLELLDSTAVDEEDMDAIFDRAGAFSSEDRGRAEQVVSMSAFRDLFASPGASKLLVHGEYDSNYPEISPLSALCASLVRALRTRPAFVCLVFFCGRHLGRRDDNNTGVSGLMRSFVSQLLRQCPSVCPDTLGPEISMSEIEDDNPEHLAMLFVDMAHRLPHSTTLVVLIDGVLLYERKQLREGLHDVVDMLVRLAEDDELMHSTVKILLTSPSETRTHELNNTFRDHGAVVSMRSMLDTGQGPSRSGVARKLEEGLSDGSNADAEA